MGRGFDRRGRDKSVELLAVTSCLWPIKWTGVTKVQGGETWGTKEKGTMTNVVMIPTF